MANDPRQVLNELGAGAKALSAADGARMTAWKGLNDAAFKGDVLDGKTKELIAAALGLAARCEYCIAHHVHGALKAGATREELIETAFATIGMGGGPSLTYAATFFLDSINTFAPDFEK